ncbi:MAG: leucyl aminopeptidase [Deltaproteobacteria bacterium CG_4_8_14_3_um_filter_45_9]|nr:MAG: leucyl aminopeptidase [Deltaproteobacteria bacterium CG03_land_8_20_14_0_80_45_14]PIX26623.1 MAG: leucyl aminopeptidase [Deltaproteobacteria bacterium CG_4_8_14_3_um_filter_45_9]
MDIKIEKGRAEKYPCELLLLFSFESPERLEGPIQSVDMEWKGFISTLMKEGDFKGELFESRLFYTQGAFPAKRALLTGLGKKGEFDLEKWRGAASKAGQFIQDSGVKQFVFPIKKFDSLSEMELAESFVTGLLLGVYQFNEFKTLERDKIKEIGEVILLGEKDEEIKLIGDGLKTGQIISEAVYLARDLVNGPSNQVTPTVLAEKAQQIAKELGMEIQVLEVGQAEAMGMGAFVAVAKGSQEPGKFIVLEYNKGKGWDTIALVGKGITFDSGGISIKPSENMDRMKDDMSGAAAVLATLQVASKLQLPLHLVGIMPATENLPSGKAYKPGDILKTLSGQTVEVISTDAEGRLILSDALTYSLRYQPKAIIDLATLTGACVIALGDYVIGLFGNEESLLKRIEEASSKTGEKVWRLPLWDEYFEYLKSDAADFRNVGTRAAGATIGAIFLSKFAEKVPWVHLDIAGPASIEKERPYIPRGGTGVGVRLLVQFLRDWK